MTSAAQIHYTERMRQLLNLPVTRLGVAGAQHGYHHLTATLADGRAVFAKAAPGTVQVSAVQAGRGSSRACRLTTRPAGSGPGGTRSSASFRTCGRRVTTAR